MHDHYSYCTFVATNCVPTMAKRILISLFSLTLLFGIPCLQGTQAAVEIIDNDFNGVNVTMSENVLHVTGAAGQVMHIYNVTGMRVMSIRIEGADKNYELNLPKGCYIVKIGKYVRKISIR